MELTWEHLVLKAEDVPATVAWYQEVLGATVVRRATSRGALEVNLELGGALLQVQGSLSDELPLPASRHPRFGVDHLVLAVADLDAALALLRDRDVPILEEAWAVRSGVRMACVAAPDGVRIELVERVQGEE